MRAWLYDEIVADSWLDAYQVIRDSDHLNQGLDYLMSALTFDNETVKLGETLSKDLYGKEINASVSCLKVINNAHLNTMRHMVCKLNI